MRLFKKLYNNNVVNKFSRSNLIFEVVSPFFPYISGIVFCTVISSIDASLRPYLIKIILDKVSVLSSNSDIIFKQIITYLSVYTIISLLIVANHRLYDFFELKMMPVLKQRIIEKCLHCLIEQSHTFFLNNSSGVLNKKVIDITMGIKNVISISITQFFGNIITLLIAISTFSQIDYILSYILMIWGMLYIIISIKFSRKTEKLSTIFWEKESIVIGSIIDILSNISVVRLFNGNVYEKNNITLWTNASVNAEQKMNWSFLKLWLIQGVSFITMQSICFAILIVKKKQGLVSVGDFALVFTINNFIFSIISSISRNFLQFGEELGRIKHGIEIIFDNNQHVTNTYIPLKINKGEICFRNVGFKYLKNQILFDNSSIVISSRQKVGVVGYSGSGKTTFINIILRLFEIQKGEVFIDQQDISKVTKESLYKAIGVISQDPILFNRSIMDNIKYGNLDATEDEVIIAAKKAYAHEFIIETQYGYQSLIGERGIKLSGGQKQRIALARAILKNAPIFLLDEATSAVDSITEKKIQNSLHAFMKNKTVVVIAHRISTLLEMERILVFDKGKIVQDGKHEFLLAQQGVYRDLWNSQINGFIIDK
ncbi:ABC transporter permease [Candidatus Megaera polyxenophila]|nr:ABC transporter permease [Candidatus Megaera polyxenophila]